MSPRKKKAPAGRLTDLRQNGTKGVAENESSYIKLQHRRRT